MSQTSFGEPDRWSPPLSAAVTGVDNTASPPVGSSPSPAIHTIGLHKRYGKTVAVQSLSMTVYKGEVFGFLGPNGAGKTTTVKILLGLARPTSGEGLVLGAPIGDRETRRRVGYLPELFRFQPWLTAREVLHLHCRLLQLAKPTWAAATDASLDTVGLTGRGDDKVAGFSKGMQQRLGFAVALLGEPDLVILDEPTSALDPVGRHDVREIIIELRRRGTTVFLNTHLLSEAEHICDRVAVIRNGTTIASGTLPELLGQHGAVRLRVDGPVGWHDQLDGFGRWHADGDWVSLDGISPERVPELVERIVGHGGQVHAVVPGHQSLENRFLELLEDR